MITRIGLSLALLAFALNAHHAAAADPAIVRPSEANATVDIGDLDVGATSVSGTVINKSSATLEVVDLVLRQEFRWNNEMNPGDDSPGRALPFKVEAHIAPNASAPFKFDFEPLQERTDGTFASTIEVTGFTKVEP